MGLRNCSSDERILTKRGSGAQRERAEEAKVEIIFMTFTSATTTYHGVKYILGR